MQILLTPVGSAGDNFPFIGLGAALARLGHRVAVLTNDHFAPMARAAGLEYLPIGSEDEYRQVISDPDIWHPRRGLQTVLSLVAQQNRRVFDTISSLRQSGPIAVVAHTLDFASRALAEKHNFPLISVHLQPSIVRTTYDLPTMTGRTNLSFLPRFLKRALWSLIDRLLLDKHAAPVANAPRTELGLPPVRHVFRDYLHAPRLSLGLWPAWYAAPQPDYPPQFRLTSFPLFDTSESTADLPEDLLTFLGAGDAPIAFTPGSANVHAVDFFTAAVRAAVNLDRRALLLTRHADQIPPNLPPTIRHIPFAPLSRLLPHCAALVHHGGVGTTAAALAAASPQLISPLSHDQPDNAARVCRLGVGDSLFPAKFTAPRLTKTLHRLLTTPTIQPTARNLAARLAQENGLADAAALVHQALADHEVARASGP